MSSITARGDRHAWAWPDSLDALIAAPNHHELLLENDLVRVVETRIAPGQVVPVHTHRWPGVQYILSLGEIIRRDDKGIVLFDARKAERLAQSPAVIWTEPLPPHSVENVGQLEICVITVELKDGYYAR